MRKFIVTSLRVLIVIAFLVSLLFAFLGYQESNKIRMGISLFFTIATIVAFYATLRFFKATPTSSIEAAKNLRDRGEFIRFITYVVFTSGWALVIVGILYFIPFIFFGSSLVCVGLILIIIDSKKRKERKIDIKPICAGCKESLRGARNFKYWHSSSFIDKDDGKRYVHISIECDCPHCGARNKLSIPYVHLPFKKKEDWLKLETGVDALIKSYIKEYFE